MIRLIAVCAVVAVVILTGGAFPSPVAADSVHLGINVGVPAPVVVAPAPVVVAPAPVVVVPPPAAIAGVPVYFYGAQYYTFYNGAWFVGPRYGGPWHHVAVAHVPRSVVVLPHRSWHGDRGWHGNGRGNRHGNDHGHPGRGPHDRR